MLNSSKVSIIMPTYNRAGYIMETIDSIRRQTYQNWELLIIDDGSDDNTEELIVETGDHRIQFYKAGRVGVNGRIKNIGLAKANGELIAFIDSDDLWAPTKIEKQVLALQQYPDAGFCLTGGYNFKEKDKPVEFFYRPTGGIKYENGFISFFKSEVAAFTQALLFRRSCLEKTGLFKEDKSFADPDFILELAWHFNMVILYESLLFRRLHEDNHSSSNWLNAYRQGIEMIHRYRDKKMLPVPIAWDALFRLHINFGEDCLLHNEKGKAMNSFFKAWMNNPLNAVPYRKMAKAAVVILRLRSVRLNIL